MLAYFPGGIIADRFSDRKLMVTSLLSTAAGGFYLYSIPSLNGLYVLFGYWGLTSILLFWAAMIKATREWAGAATQGLAFGFLDGGRGFVASVFASIGVIILNLFAFEQTENLTQQTTALQSVIIFYSISTLLAALVIWWLVPEHVEDNSVHTSKNETTSDHKLISVIGNKTIWLQAGVVIAAYCGYKALDNYGLFAVQVLGMSNLESAEFTTLASYSRPIAAIAAGLIADRWHSSKLVLTLFAIATMAFFSLNIISSSQITTSIILANLVITFVAVYALRGIYFTLLEETKLDLSITGKAVGLISVLGYTPDIFFAPLTGRILDANPGVAGFQNYFILIALFSAAGLLFAYGLTRTVSRNTELSSSQ